MAAIHYSDVYDLAAHLVGLDSWEYDEEEMQEKLYEKYNIDLDDFCKIIARITPMIDVGTSELTDKTYKGFGTKDKNGNGIWLLKIEV